MYDPSCHSKMSLLEFGKIKSKTFTEQQYAPLVIDILQFYLILNVAVGGTNGYFPDSIVNEGYAKPWNNSDSKAFEAFWKAKSLWYPTWKGDDAAMQIDSIKMWQLE